MPSSKSQIAKDVKITKKYKKLLQHLSTSNDLDGELSNEQSDNKISYTLRKADELFEALSRSAIQS